MAPGAELQDSMGTNAQSLQLLPNYALGHLSAQILVEQTYTTILRERGVKTLTLVPIKGYQCADRCSEAVSDLWEKHQPLPLILG